MKKAIIMALVIMAGAFTAQAAGDKKQKKAKAAAETVEVKVEPVVLVSEADSISYATGMAVTQGLLEYLQQRCEVDSTYMADFKRGFEDAISAGSDPKYNAYKVGIQIADQLQKQIMPRATEPFEDSDVTINEDLLIKGFLAGAMGDNSVYTVEDAAAYSSKRSEEIKKRQSAAYIEKNTAWLAENAKKEGVVVLPSGLQYKVITAGTGAVATNNDNVTVKYEGKMIDGTVFDSSYTRTPDTTSFRPNQVIKGWTEALCMMPEGSKWELYIPQELGYGERPAGKIKPYSTLIFTVEVVKVEK